MNHVEMRQRALDAFERIRAIRSDAGDNLTDEQVAEIEKLTNEAEAALRRAEVLRRVDTNEASLDGNAPRTPEADASGGTRRSHAASSGAGSGGGAAGVEQRLTAVVDSVRDRILDDRTCGFGPELRETYSPRQRRHCLDAGMGEFSLSVMEASVSAPSEIDPRLLPLRRKARRERGAAATGMSQGVGADGGFTIPPEFSSIIYDGLNTGADALLPMTDQYTVEGESLTFNANAEISRANGSRYGGIQGYWINEAGAITPSQPRFRRVTIEPQELAIAVYLTDKLMRNAPVALGQFVTRASRDEMNFKIGDSIINGTGVGQPLGILASAATIAVSRASQGADTFFFANMVAMWARLHARARARAVWLINQDVEPQLNAMAFDPAATDPSPVYLPQNQVVNSPFSQLFGRPVIPIEYCATLGDVGDVILADLGGGYVTGTRGTVNEAFSMHVKFLNAESVFRFIFEVDGRPWLQQPLTPFKGTNTLSHFVVASTAT